MTMWRKIYDTDTDKTYDCNLSVLPYISIPKEQYEQMCTMFEYEDIGRIHEAIFNYIYNDIEPNFETKPERGFFKTTIDAITRTSLKYFKKLSTLKNQSGAVRVVSSNTSEEKNVEITSNKLTDFIQKHKLELCLYNKWDDFVEEHPNAEDIRLSANIGILTAQDMFNRIKGVA